MKSNPVRPKDRFLVFGSPLIGEEEIQEVAAACSSGLAWCASWAALIRAIPCTRRT